MRPVMRLLLGLLLLPAVLVAQAGTDRRFAATPDVAVRLVNLVGYVRVVGWDRDTVAVLGELPPEAGTLVAGGTREAIKVAIERPVVMEEYAGATLEVRVPRGARLAVKAAAASISISGLTGDVEVGVAKGRVQVEGTPRTVVAETILGDIECDGAIPQLQLRSLSGSVVVRGATGTIAVTTVTGAISVGGVRLTHGRFESTAGAVDVKGALARDGTLEVQTHGGDVTLRLPPALNARLDLGTDSGRFSSDFPALRRAPRRGAPVQATLGDGRGRVRVRTFTGAVRLQRQP